MLARQICLAICHCQHNDNVLRVTKMSSGEEIRWLGPHSCIKQYVAVVLAVEKNKILPGPNSLDVQA